MKQPKTFLLLSVVVAVLILGVAYANIANVPFAVNGTATATPLASNFKVAFKAVNVDTEEVSGDGKITYSAEDQLATFTVTGLTTLGQSATVKFTVANTSDDITAVLKSVNVSNDNGEYFTVTHSIENLEVAPKGETEISVTVTMAKNPVTNQTANISVTFDAEAKA